MKFVRYTGQHPVVFHGIGELAPGQMKLLEDHIADSLVARGEFEVVKPPQKKATSSKLDVDKNATPGVDTVKG